MSKQQNLTLPLASMNKKKLLVLDYICSQMKITILHITRKQYMYQQMYFISIWLILKIFKDQILKNNKTLINKEHVFNLKVALATIAMTKYWLYRGYNHKNMFYEGKKEK